MVNATGKSRSPATARAAFQRALLPAFERANLQPSSEGFCLWIKKRRAVRMPSLGGAKIGSEIFGATINGPGTFCPLALKATRFRHRGPAA